MAYLKKKGVVYRMTMLAGPLMVAGWTLGECSYSELMKERRNEEIKEDKAVTEKIKSMIAEGEEDEKLAESDLPNPLRTREKYKEDRLKKVKDLRYKPDQTTAPSIEELKSKPSLKEVRERPLVLKDKLHLDKEDKDGGYM